MYVNMPVPWSEHCETELTGDCDKPSRAMFFFLGESKEDLVYDHICQKELPGPSQ